MPSFAENIKGLRTSNKLSQKQLATQIGISDKQLQRYESGEQQPTLPIVIKLADYFHVSLDYLVGRSDDPMRH